MRAVQELMQAEKALSVVVSVVHGVCTLSVRLALNDQVTRTGKYRQSALAYLVALQPPGRLWVEVGAEFVGGDAPQRI